MPFPLINVTEKENVLMLGSNYSEIRFQVQDYVYFINVLRNPQRIFYFGSIVHSVKNEDTPCPLCEKDTRICFALNPYRNEIIQELIESPSLRLPWLYRTYTFER